MKKLLSVALLLMTGLSSVVYAAEDTRTFVNQVLEQLAPGLTVAEVASSPVAGMDEVVLTNGDILYVNSEAKSFLIGQMVTFTEEEGLVNVTELKKQELSVARNGERKAAIAKIKPEEKVTFSPEGEVKARLHVFTDISCPYCVKLHGEVAALNKMGIEVSYLAFPRAGAGSQAHRQMNTIWCAGDEQARRDAMDKAKTGGGVRGSDCESPVMGQMQIGQAMGVTGTPALLLEDGSLVPGYVPAAQLAQRLGVK